MPEYPAPPDTPGLANHRFADVAFFLLRDAQGRVRAYLHACREVGCEGTRYSLDERRHVLLCRNCGIEVALAALDDRSQRCRPVEIPCIVDVGRVRIDPRALLGDRAPTEPPPNLTVRPAIEVGCGDSVRKGESGTR